MTDQEVLTRFAPIFGALDDFSYLAEKRPLLAHYTSIQVLEKILRQEELWLSNPLFMNDLEEMRFGIHQGVSLFEKISADIAHVAGSLDRFKILEHSFMEYFRKFDAEHALDIYVFCLSEHDREDNDGLLSMWRAYGGNGNGAALVFDSGFIAARNDSSPLIIAKVRYASGAERKAWLEARLRQWCQILQENPLPDDKLYLAAYSIFGAIKIYALTSKHRGFREENEWRVIYMPDRDVKGILRGSFGYVIGPRGVEPKLKLKIRPLPLDPPEMWTFENILDRIILGPSLSTALARNSVIRMMQMIPKPEFCSKVTSSEIPLRPS